MHPKTALTNPAAPLLCSLVLTLQACGPDSAPSPADGTSTGDGDGDTGDTGDGDGDGNGDGDGDTGDTDTCGCTADEVCVANADDFCGSDFGYTKSCVPISECEGDCSCEQICGDWCVAACDYADVDVDFWCGHSWVTECGIVEQDCPDGEKCVPYATTGGGLDANKCVPIQGDGAPGEACTYGGVVEATDDCDGQGFCYGTEGNRTCRAFCAADESCTEDAQVCFISNEGVIAMCSLSCDPLSPDGCPIMGDGCFATGGAAEAPFVCLPGINGLGQDQPCGYINDCDQGLVCVGADYLDQCADGNCCTALCSLDDPNACAGLEPLICLSYFDPEPPPAGFEQLGICILP